jgi:hypothetical protein
VAEFVLVAGAEAENSRTAVKLVAHVLVHLAEFVQFTRNVVVLELHHLGMLLKGVLLREVVHVLTTEGIICHLRLLEVLSLKEELVIAVLQAGLKFSHLSGHVKVACTCELVLLAKIVVVR